MTLAWCASIAKWLEPSSFPHHREILLSLAVIAVASLLPFLFSGIAGIVSPFDANFPLFPSTSYVRYTSTWTYTDFLGHDGTYRNPPQMVYYALLSGLSYLIPNLSLLNRLWSVLIFGLGGFSMFYLFLVLVKGRGATFGALIAGLFYMFNPARAQLLVHGISGYSLFWSALPLAFALFLRIFEAPDSRTMFRSAFGFACVFTLTQLANDLQYILMSTLIFGIYVVIRFLFIGLRNFTKGGLALLTALLLTLGLNLFWILPLFSNFAWSYQYYKTAQLTMTNLAQQSGLSFVNILRLYNSPGWSLDAYYGNSLVLDGGVLLLGLSTLAFLRKTNFRSMASVFTGVALVIFAILSRGVASPFGGLYSSIFSLPGGAAFLPTAPQKWLFFLALPASLLIGLAAAAGVNAFRRSARWRKSWAGVYLGSIIFLLLLDGFPLLYPVAIRSANTGGFNYMSSVDIPSYYFEAGTWLSSQGGDFRVFVTPPALLNGWVSPTWAPYSLADPTQYMSNKRVFTDDVGATFASGPGQLSLIRSIEKALSGNQSAAVAGPILGMISVRYILCRDDLSYKPCRLYFNPDSFPEVERFGALQFYANPYFSPLIYAARHVVTTLGISDVSALASVPGLSLNSTSVLMGDRNSSISEFASLSDLVLVNDSSSASQPRPLAPLLASAQLNKTTLVYVLSTSNHQTMSNDTIKVWVDLGASYTLVVAGPSSVARITNLDTGQVVVADVTERRLSNYGDRLSFFGPMNLTSGEYSVTIDGASRGVVLASSDGVFPNRMHDVFGSGSGANASFEEVSPTEFLVRVGSSSGAVLAFTDGFDSQWVARSDDGSFLGHMVIDGYANGFMVPAGEHTIKLTYMPQNALNLGEALSYVALVSAAGLIVLQNARKKPSPPAISQPPKA